MKSTEIRQAFLEFFKSKGHEIIPSSSLVPHNDPTLLFTNAGMNQFKDCFLGAEKRDYLRATSSQKCMRVSGKHNDLEEVGISASHHTLFEMLGNFSFGDYFKTDAIKFAWEFLTEVLKLDKQKLWITIFEEDDEAGELWKKHTDVNPDRVLKLGEKENFWTMGETGPCGPCSEIHYYIGNSPENQSAEEFYKDDGTYVEIWNLVFMQFDKSADGALNPLPAPAVDTGMGFERLTSILQDKKTNYDTDLLRGLIAVCEELSGFKYDGTSFERKNLREDKNYARDVAMRVIADHSRAAAFLIADGVMPSTDGRGYVLRRVMRRAIRHSKTLEFKEPFLAKVADKVIDIMGDHYSELKEQRDLILKLIDTEERKFYETLDSGLEILKKEIEKLKAGENFPGKTAFLLHDTYGFPLDLTQDALKAYSLTVDTKAFNSAMQTQKERSRGDRKSKGIAFASVNIKSPETSFTGYKMTESEAKVTQIIKENNSEETVSLLFDTTPFYAESGGQVADTGTVILPSGAELEVKDVQKTQDKYFIHSCKIIRGSLSNSDTGSTAVLRVDKTRRKQIMAHHSATHLVNAALRKVLGDHVKQSGSRVDNNGLRFDYSHFEAVSDSQLQEIQSLVNGEIRKNDSVETKVQTLKEAKESGALAFFGEKYGDSVRVVKMGEFSMEFCGGTHVNNTGDIGLVLINSDAGISAGVRRIECKAGAAALEAIVLERGQRSRIASLFKSDESSIEDKVKKTLGRVRELEKEVEQLKGRLAVNSSAQLSDNTQTSPSGIKVITEIMEDADNSTLKSTVDRLRVKLGTGVVALGSKQGDKAMVVIGVTSDLKAKVHAGNLLKEALAANGGKGGGRPDFAQGGVPSENFDAVLTKIFSLIE